jgi:hypothetical protein
MLLLAHSSYQVMNREGYRCAFSGTMDSYYMEELSRFNPSDQRLNEFHGYLEVGHILPFCLNNFAYNMENDRTVVSR